MSDNAYEHYEIKNEDKELHVIDVMLEALSRHLDGRQDNPNCRENIQNGAAAMVRCARYVLERVEGLEE